MEKEGKISLEIVIKAFLFLSRKTESPTWLLFFWIRQILDLEISKCSRKIVRTTAFGSWKLLPRRKLHRALTPESTLRTPRFGLAEGMC
jgi:hypothetical protein